MRREPARGSETSVRAAEARFEDHPVAVEKPGAGVRLDVSDLDVCNFRKRLRAALTREALGCDGLGSATSPR